MFFRNRKYIQARIINSIPHYIQREYPLFVKLIELFYDFMEEENNVLYNLEHLENHNNFISPYVKWWDRIYDDAGFDFSNQLKIDKRQFFNYLMDFYMYRGSIQGTKFIIKALYGVDANVTYPREEMFIPSYADYVDNQYMVVKLTDIPTNLFNNISNSIKDFSLTIKSNSSDDVIDIENANSFVYEGEVYLNLKVLYTSRNKFKIGEQLTLSGGDYSIKAIHTPLIGLKVIEGGTLYKRGDVVIVNNSVNKGYIKVNYVSTGSIYDVEILSAGHGYVVGDYIYTDTPADGTGGGFYAEVTEVSSGGEIVKIKVLNKGHGFSHMPNMTVFSKTGTGASIKGKTKDIGQIKSFEYIENAAVNLLKIDTNNITFDIQSEHGSNAVIEPELLVVNKTTSYYKSREGVFDDTSYITDSLYYQQFSYKINTTIPRYEYDAVMDDLNHTFGYIRYASFSVANGRHKLKPNIKTKFIMERFDDTENVTETIVKP